MKIITPITMADAKLISSDITEDDHAEWDISTTYSRGDYAISTTTHTVYRSLTDSNLGNDPDAETAALADPLTDDPDPVNWQVISATNRWKMFDQKPSVQSSRTDDITIEVAPGEFIGGVAGFALSGTSVRVEGYIPGSPDDTIYDTTVDLYDDDYAYNWYDYFFQPLTPITEFTLTDLPPYQDAVWRVTVTNTGGTAKAGQIVFGKLYEIGSVIIPGTGWSGLDFSYVENDEFGNLTRVVREATRVFDFEVEVPTALILTLFERLRALRGGTSAVWVGDDRNELGATAYGFARDYRLVYQAGSVSVISIQVQGMV